MCLRDHTLQPWEYNNAASQNARMIRYCQGSRTMQRDRSEVVGMYLMRPIALSTPGTRLLECHQVRYSESSTMHLRAMRSRRQPSCQAAPPQSQRHAHPKAERVVQRHVRTIGMPVPSCCRKLCAPFELSQQFWTALMIAEHAECGSCEGAALCRRASVQLHKHSCSACSRLMTPGSDACSDFCNCGFAQAHQVSSAHWSRGHSSCA